MRRTRSPTATARTYDPDLLVEKGQTKPRNKFCERHLVPLLKRDDPATRKLAQDLLLEYYQTAQRDPRIGMFKPQTATKVRAGQGPQGMDTVLAQVRAGAMSIDPYCGRGPASSGWWSPGGCSIGAEAKGSPEGEAAPLVTFRGGAIEATDLVRTGTTVIAKAGTARSMTSSTSGS